ncbi:MAG: hypothetical protein FJZ92_05010 [Chloroflexi bacterium]|nr:hypothetical protein [Chloroflexota bacterium]
MTVAGPDTTLGAQPPPAGQGGALGPDGNAGAPARPRFRFRIDAAALVLTVLVTLTLLMFVLVEPSPRWLLVFAAAIAVLGVDGALRARREPGGEPPAAIDTIPFLFLPALFAVAAPLLIEHNARGYAVIPSAVAAGVAFGAIAVAAPLSVTERGRTYAVARLVATSGAYFAAFALFSLVYVFDLGPRAAVGAVALAATMLAVEVLREGRVDALETLVFSAVTGLVLGEVRWALHYLPVDGYLAGLTLVLAFFFVSGLLNAHLTRRLDVALALEYVVIVGLGIALVVLARAGGAA